MKSQALKTSIWRPTARKVLQIEADAITALMERLDERFDQAVALLAQCQGRIVVTGMGKSGIICRKIAATLSSTGTPALFLHPAEAIHGDLGMLMPQDTVLMVSNSGETSELVQLLETVKRMGLRMIAMVGKGESVLARSADLVLDVGVDQEACPFGLAPTASTTAALSLGDALAICLSVCKGFQLEEFASLHPGGRLGKRLKKAGELMQSGEQIPLVGPDTRMEDVIYEMSRKGLGITAVVDESRKLLGVISDGDLRRLLQSKQSRFLELSARECMTPNPVTIDRQELAAAALNLLEQKKITALMVTDSEGRLAGVLHLHSLWGMEMI